MRAPLAGNSINVSGEFCGIIPLTNPVKPSTIRFSESRYFVAVVLCSGSDKSLLETRRLILERAGHTVVTVSNEPSLLEACKKHSFDVAVIGQSVPTKLKPRIARLIRQHCPNAKILELFPPHIGKLLQDADAWLLVPADVPHDLVERVNELASRGERGEHKEA